MHSMSGRDAAETAAFEVIFRRVHAAHPACLDDPWLSSPCRDRRGRPVDRPYVWSRRNGAWRRSEVLWVGSAPGNAGGRGSGDLGAHGTRIPFGGDVAGGNLDVLLSSINLTRNDTFIVAALNHLPRAGGGEPTLAELAEPVGDYANSLQLLHDTILAVGPRLLVALGNTGLRATLAATGPATDPPRLPTIARLRRAGLRRGAASPWPEAGVTGRGPSRFAEAWRDTWGEAPLPHLLWLTHPSAQNMSPYAGRETVFHARMVETRRALRAAVAQVLGWDPPARRARRPPATGIYALPEWRERVGPRHTELDELWRRKGV